MAYAAGAIYVSKVFDQALKNSTLDMVNDLQEALQRLLVEQDWMDRATKKVLFCGNTKTSSSGLLLLLTASIKLLRGDLCGLGAVSWSENGRRKAEDDNH
ncbi:hypothetical protein COOONC_02909 [Cooperia oncophora]